MKDAVELILSISLFYLAWELQDRLNFYDVVYLVEVHDFCTVNESLQVDHKNVGQRTNLCLLRNLFSFATIITRE